MFFEIQSKFSNILTKSKNYEKIPLETENQISILSEKKINLNRLAELLA